MEVLQIKDITFTYPDSTKQTLQSISATVEQGEFVLVCGESGSGKSTLLRLLKPELAPVGEQTGDICYCGQPLADVEPRILAGDIGFVMQDPEQQIVTDTVWQELAFGPESLGLETQVIRRRVAEMASYFGIEGYFTKKISTLSGGQKQLLNLAAVMVMQPKVLLLDEPTAQLDPIAAADFMATLLKLNRELGLTILLIEHRLEEIFPLVDRVWVLEKGKMIVDTTPRMVSHAIKKHNAKHPMLEALPAAVRVFSGLDGEGECPLTVREGHSFLTKHFPSVKPQHLKKQFKPNAKPLIEWRELWFRYEKEAQDVISGAFGNLYPSEILAVLGGNGAGKSTLLRLLCGLNSPYRGQILVQGKPRRAGKQDPISIGLLPQDPQTLFASKTVKEDLLAVCRRKGIKEKEIPSFIEEVSNRLGITDVLNRHPYDISGGEQQKAALAMLLLCRPDVLLLDEPTKGLDAFAKRDLARVLSEIREEGRAVLLVTHDVEFAAISADRCSLFFGGESVGEAPPHAFFAENHFYTTAANRMARGFLEHVVTVEEILDAVLGKTGGC